MIEFVWPLTEGEWLAWTSAFVMVIIGLWMLFMPRRWLSLMGFSPDAHFNEASAALRGLFVFGHHSGNYSRHDNERSSSGQVPNSQSLSRAPGGFNLHHNPDSGSSDQQEGLRIIDDDEAAFEIAASDQLLDQ